MPMTFEIRAGQARTGLLDGCGPGIWGFVTFWLSWEGTGSSLGQTPPTMVAADV
jgi:hypothetical protein